MKYSVIKAFTCKLDHRKYKRGDTYETNDPARAEFLQSKGRLGAMIDDPPPVEPPADNDCVEMMKHVGGGHYEILVGANKGKRVKGKEAAEQEALAGLTKEREVVEGEPEEDWETNKFADEAGD